MAISTRRPARLLILAGLSVLVLSPAVLAGGAGGGPTGGFVVRGSAQIAQAGARTTIRQQSRRAVIDWRGFDVDRGHTVVFSQPGRDASTLNRVDSATPSIIKGSIKAPGTVVIQNGAGVLFTGNARVDVGGLVATGQTVDAGRFMQDGTVSTTGDGRQDARIVNRGRITVGGAGLAALVGGDVENAGTIVARRGTVMLAGGKRTAIDMTGDGMVKLVVSGSGSAVQSGMIDVGDGRVVITAGAAADALDAVINTSGIIRAAGPDGSIRIRGRNKAAARIDGRLEADAGSIRISGQKVALTRRATLAAGTVTALARDTARVDGRIVAHGGFVETSAVRSVGIARTAEIQVGPGGRWLIDPRDIIIGTTGSAPGASPPGNTPLSISRIALQNALNAGTDVTITTAQPASAMAGDITVASPLTWTGTGDLTLRADRDITINAAISSSAGDFSALATRNLRIDADLRARGIAAVRLEAAQGYLRVARHSSSVGQVLSTERGALGLAAPRGKVEIGRLGGESGYIHVSASAGATSIRAGDEIHIWGADIDGGWTRIGAEDSSATISLTAPAVTVRGGAGPTSFAEIVAGAGGALTLEGSSRIVVTGTNAEGRVAALDGAPLNLTAPVQYWNGPVRSGSGRTDGGTVRVTGTVSAPVEPRFSLAPGADFTLRTSALPIGGLSGYVSPQPLAVSTSGSGTVSIDGRVTASHVTLLSDAAVRLGPAASLRGTASGDAIVVSAGTSFVNEASAGVLQGDRWLLYLDRFDSMTGTVPADRGFDLYGRRHATNPPATLGFGGNRIVYAERPTLVLTADSLRKTYGTTVAPGYAIGGLRPGDDFGTALAGAPTVSSAGGPATAPAGIHPTRVAATASAQGYALAFVDGTLTVDPAALTVTANDATRRYGASNPAFSVRIDGFVLGEGEEVLGGSLAFAAPDRSSPVGAYDVAPSGLTAADGNYAITFRSGTLTVTPTPLTIMALDSFRTYGASNPAFGARFSGFVLGEDRKALDGTLSFTTDATRTSDTARHAVTPSGLASGNYAITFRRGILTIDPAALTVTALDASRTYGTENPAFSARFDGFVLGQESGALKGRLGFDTSASDTSGVGGYAVTPGGLTSGNYAITFRSATLTVDPAPLTVTALAAGRAVGEANPAFSARLDGFVLGEDAAVLGGQLAFTTLAGPASPAGKYAITPGGLTSDNYRITYQPGTLTVQPASVPPILSTAPALAGAERFARGVPPLTPGDASFRTTVTEAPPALANPFGLTYSLGEVLELTAPGAAGADGFVAAAADTGGFTPAAFARQADAEDGAAAATAGACGGSVNRGAATDGCATRAAPESFWTSRR